MEGKSFSGIEVMLALVVDEPLVLKALTAKVQKQCSAHAGCLEIVDDLSVFFAGKAIKRFQLNNDLTKADVIYFVESL